MSRCPAVFSQSRLGTSIQRLFMHIFLQRSGSSTAVFFIHNLVLGKARPKKWMNSWMTSHLYVLSSAVTVQDCNLEGLPHTLCSVTTSIQIRVKLPSHLFLIAFKELHPACQSEGNLENYILDRKNEKQLLPQGFDSSNVNQNCPHHTKLCSLYLSFYLFYTHMQLRFKWLC